MTAKAFFDTNIIVYAFSSDDRRSERAYALMQEGGVISVQVLNELVSVWRRKQQRSWAEIDEALSILKRLLDPPTPLTVEVHDAAVEIARDRGFSIYDSLIVASALRAGCATLYSEDMQHRQTIEQLIIHDPFADSASP